MNNFCRILLCCTIATLLLCLLGCRRDPVPPFSLESITKSQRELLGKRLEIALLTQPTIFPIRSGAGGSNEILYTYLQEYYNQASYFFKLDRNASMDDRWDQNKLWRVRILESEVPNSFTLPGGDLYISTGMLALLKSEAELYALLSFEVILMQEKVILKELIEKYPADTFIDLLELGESQEGLNERDVLSEFLNLHFEDAAIINVDKQTQTHICSSSAFDKNSLFRQLENLEAHGESPWLEQKSYGGRILFIQQLTPEVSCGTRNTDGSYQEKVLDLL